MYRLGQARLLTRGEAARLKAQVALDEVSCKRLAVGPTVGFAALG